MAYDQDLAVRVRAVLEDRAGVDERRMFGGIAFMLDGNMICGIIKDLLLVRVGPRQYTDALARPYAREMDLTGRPMTGMVIVAPDGVASDADLKDWVECGAGYASSLPPK